MGLLNSFIRKGSWSVSSLSHFEASVLTPKLMRSLQKRKQTVVGRRMNDLPSLLRLESPCAFHTICPLPQIFARKAIRASKRFAEVALLMQMLNLRCLLIVVINVIFPSIFSYHTFSLSLFLTLHSFHHSSFPVVSLFLIVWVLMLFSRFMCRFQGLQKGVLGRLPSQHISGHDYHF